MYKLLRSTCLHCFQLKMRQTEVDKYTEKLQLLAKGKLTEAAAVMTGGGKAAETAKSFVEAGDEENLNENMLKGKGKHKANGSAAPLDGTLMIHPYYQECKVVASLCWHGMPSCQAVHPSCYRLSIILQHL